MRKGIRKEMRSTIVCAMLMADLPGKPALLENAGRCKGAGGMGRASKRKSRKRNLLDSFRSEKGESQALGSGQADMHRTQRCELSSAMKSAPVPVWDDSAF